MSDHLDTSIVVRYLTGDPPEMAARARALIESNQVLLVSSVCLLEAAHTLRTYYQVPREVVVDALTRFVARRNIATRDAEKAYVITGLGFCRPSGRVSFGDALIWAAARTDAPSGGRTRVHSFDERFPPQDIDHRIP